MLLKGTVRDILLVLLYVLFAFSRDPPPRTPPPPFPVNPAWYHVSFPDDGNFLSASRLTYFLPDNGLKFHAVVVTIHSKKLIELDQPEGDCRVIQEGPAGEREDSPRGANETFQSFPAVLAPVKSTRYQYVFLRELNEAKEGPASPLGDLTRGAWTALFTLRLSFFPFFFLTNTRLLEHGIRGIRCCRKMAIHCRTR